MVELQNHELNEQLVLINQLDKEEKKALIKIINSMLTKKRMKDLLDGKANLYAFKKPRYCEAFAIILNICLQVPYSLSIVHRCIDRHHPPL